MLFRLPIDKYTTEPLNQIFKDEKENAFFKRISEHETLFVKKIEAKDPDVRVIVRTTEIISSNLLQNLVVTKYTNTYLSQHDRQEFIDEVTKMLNESRSTAAFERKPAIIPSS